MLSNITLGQYYPGNSFVHKLDPRTKIIAVILYIITVFFANDAISYGILIGALAILMISSRLPAMTVFKSLKPLLPILILTFLVHLFTGTGGETYFHWKIITITQNGLIMGVKMVLRLALLLMASSILTLTTSPIVLTDGIESLLNPFKRIGVPAHELAMMMTIALRFIPTLLEETDKIMKAQASRGADFTQGNILQRAKNMLPILIPLFISAFRRADDLAIAMESRCYRGGEGRTRMHELKYRHADFQTIGFFILLFFSLATLKWGNSIYALFNA